MSTTSKKQSTQIGHPYVQEVHLLEIGANNYAFRTQAAATAAYRAMSEALEVSTAAYELDNIYHRVLALTDESARQPELTLKRELVQACPNEALPSDGDYTEYRCDHYVLGTKSQLCGVTKCYRSTNDREQAIEVQGWKVSSGLDEKGRERVVVTCPDCLDKIADAAGFEDPDLLTGSDLIEAWRLGRQAAERS